MLRSEESASNAMRYRSFHSIHSSPFPRTVHRLQVDEEPCYAAR